MKAIRPPHHDNRLVLRGLHLWLTDTMKAAMTRKAQRLFRHEPRIVRIRIDVDCEQRRGVRMFPAKGHVEVHGPDLIATVTTPNAYRSIDLLIGKLDRMLRRRATAYTANRSADDIRAHPVKS